MPTARRSIKAKDIVADILSGMDDAALMKKYEIPRTKLPEIMDKLVNAGLIRTSELQGRGSLPELQVVAKIEFDRTRRDSPLSDFMAHFIKQTLSAETHADAELTSRPLFEDCFGLKQNRIAELASKCLQLGDLAGGTKTIALIADRFPESRRLKSLNAQLELAYKNEASRLLEMSWKRGGLSECQRLADLMLERFSDSPMTKSFADQFSQRVREISDYCIDEHMARNDPETAYQILMGMRQQLSESGDAAETLDEAIEYVMPKLTAIRSFMEELAHLNPQTDNTLKRFFPSVLLERMSNRQIEFLKNPTKAFHDNYPSVALHPAVERIVKVIHYQFYGTNEYIRKIDMFELQKIMAKVAACADRFSKLTDLEATRLWHLLTLVQMKEDCIESYYITTLEDDASCDVCIRLVGEQLMIKDVHPWLERFIEAKHGEFFAEVQFPTYADLNNRSPAQRAEYLTREGLIAPPFCHNCRCWIVPLTGAS